VLIYQREVIRIRKSKNRPHNEHKKNDKRKNNDLKNNTCLTPPLFIEVSVPRQESEWSGMGIDVAFFSDFSLGTVAKVWHLFGLVFMLS
jgi:hypothetical protein